MSSAYFVPLVSLPTIINAPGIYRTRDGSLVMITAVSTGHNFGCKGHYFPGSNESWHKSGRLYASRISDNDIIERCVQP